MTIASWVCVHLLSSSHCQRGCYYKNGHFFFYAASEEITRSKTTLSLAPSFIDIFWAIQWFDTYPRVKFVYRRLRMMMLPTRVLDSWYADESHLFRQPQENCLTEIIIPSARQTKSNRNFFRPWRSPHLSIANLLETWRRSQLTVYGVGAISASKPHFQFLVIYCSNGNFILPTVNILDCLQMCYRTDHRKDSQSGCHINPCTRIACSLNLMINSLPLRLVFKAS